MVIKKKVAEEETKAKGSSVAQKPNQKKETEVKEKKSYSSAQSAWTPNWLTVILVIIIALAMIVTFGIIENRVIKTGSVVKATANEVTTNTAGNEETGKVTTYEEFKKEAIKLLELNLTDEEFQKKLYNLIEELGKSSSVEWQKLVNDFIKGVPEWWQNAIKENVKSSAAETTLENKEFVILEPATIDWNTPWYRSPWPGSNELLDDQLKDELTWETLAEPGVFPGMNNTQTRWNDWSAEETPMLVPEGGYLYFATGKYTLWLFNQEKNEKTFLFEAPAAKERIYLTIVRGLPADGGDLDLNQIVMATDYVRAAGTYHDMHTGAYVSLGWFLQQIDASWEPAEGLQDPNVGENGAEDVRIVLIDLKTQTVRVWKVIGPTDRDWERVDNLS